MSWLAGIVGAIKERARSLLAAPLRSMLRGPSGGTPVVRTRPTKTEKKMRRYLRVTERRKYGREVKAAKLRDAQQERREWLQTLDAEGRAEEKRLAHEAMAATRLANDALKASELARLKTVYADGSGATRVAIDLAYMEKMSPKERKSLGRQLGYAYSTNRKLDHPFALHVCALPAAEVATSDWLPNGFDRWTVRTTEGEAGASFPVDELIYLSPDSPNVLDRIDPAHVYVVGGLVDGTVKKSTTLRRAQQLGVRTARLPIQEHAAALKHVLTINGVIELLARFRDTGDWATALQPDLLSLAKKNSRGIAPRKGGDAGPSGEGEGAGQAAVGGAPAAADDAGTDART
jgi:tRNA (guanine9-N1)-methyltransferase